MPERLTERDSPDGQAGVRPLSIESAGIPAFSAAAPPIQRVVLGLLVVILGGILLSRTLLGLPTLAAGAWLATGRGLPELRRGVMENAGYLLRCLLSGTFFIGAICQAWHALLPTLPLFGISVLLLPSTRDQDAATQLLRISPAVREVLIAILLGVYGRLLAQDLSEKTEAERQTIVRAMAKDQADYGYAD